MTIHDDDARARPPWLHSRSFWVVRVESTRREYVCVEQEERGDRVWYKSALRDLVYDVDWKSDAAQAAEMQAVMSRHGFRRVIATRRPTAHDLLRLRRLANLRRLDLTVELP